MSISQPDLTLTKFPDSQDSYQIYSDVNADNVDLVNQFKAYIANKDFTSATQLIANNTSLQNVIITATTLQRHEDQILAVERTWSNSIEQQVAAIVKWQGTYNGSISYKMFNVVVYTGKIYMNVVVDTPVGTIPTNTDYWIPLSIVGPAGTGLTPYKSWDNTYTYNDVALVPYSNQLWMSLQNSNLNHSPDSSPDWWVSVFTAPKQTIISSTQPINQSENDIWYEVVI